LIAIILNRGVALVALDADDRGGCADGEREEGIGDSIII
jgi:hypothetical protein